MLTASAAALLIGASGYALQGRPGLVRRIAAAVEPGRRICAAGRGAPRILRAVLGSRKLAGDVRGARAPRQAPRMPRRCSRTRCARRPGDAAIVDRSRQCPGRPFERPDPARRIRLIAAPPRSIPAHPAPVVLLWAGAGAIGRSGERARDLARAARRTRRPTPTGAPWSRRALPRSTPPQLRPRAGSRAGRALRRPAGCGSCRRKR